jgi:conjugal transfer/entry exclusion protein
MNTQNKSDNVKSVMFSIKHAEEKVEQLQSRLNENYLGNFAWAAEDLWRQSFIVIDLKRKLNYLLDEETSLTELEKINEIIDTYQNILDRTYNVRSNSSGSLHREVSTWEYQENLDLKRFFKTLLNS